MFPTYKDGDEITCQEFTKGYKPEINDIVIFSHPFQKNMKLIKRITKIIDNSKLFVEGDNDDYSSTEDSHNFGYIDINKIIAIKKGEK